MPELTPRDNLGSVADKFGRRGSRASGLGSLISAPSSNDHFETGESADTPAPHDPVRAERAQNQHTESSRSSHADEAPAAPIRRPMPRRRRSTTQVTVYVTAGVKKRFEDYRQAKKGRTSNDVVLEAVAANHARLQDILEDAKYYSTGTTVASDLFPVDARRVRYLGGGDSQIQFNVTSEQMAVLERLREELGMKTLSTWLAPVLNEFLPGKREKQR